MIGKIAICFILVSRCFTNVAMTWAQGINPSANNGSTNVENYTQELFFLSQSTGSASLHGVCTSTNVSEDVLTDSLSHPPKGPFSTIDEALNALSNADQHLSWYRDGKGLLRVKDSRALDDVLRIQLKYVHFAGASNPGEAIRYVMSNNDVKTYFKKNQIEEGMVFNSLMPMQTKKMPLLSGYLRNVTVAEALDHVMQFFHGVWIYDECSNGPHRRVIITGTEVSFPG